MSWQSFKEEAVNGVLGRNEKAKLILYKGGKSDALSGEVLKDTQEALGDAGSSMNSLKGAMSKHHILKVQYNPASIRFEANVDEIPTRWLEDNFDATLPNQQKRSASIVMYVDLIFDAVNNKDAFYSVGDKLQINPGDIAASVGTGIKKLAGGYSVLKQTNGLVAAMTNASTRVVSFLWADMKFTGILEQVQARYTMFSPSGRPIRSSITLSMQQSLDRDEVGQWEKAFNNFFGKKEIALKNINGKSSLQEMEKLINIRF
jgi:hypothetical protein